MDRFLLSILACPNGCESDLQFNGAAQQEELLCPVCRTRYPIISGIPVLFPDEPRRNFTIDKGLQWQLIEKIASLEQEIRYENRDKHRAVFSSEEVESLAWEYFFWWNWVSNEDYGTIKFCREEIKRYLEEDREGGGRKRFFEMVKDREISLNKKLILNVGAGRDFLLEEFLEAGALVIEQDIILDALLALQQRGAPGICSDLRSLPIKPGSIDIVTSFGTLHHVWPIETPIRETVRIIRPGGALYLNEPNGWAVPVLARSLLDRIPSKLRRMIVAGVMLSGHSPAPHEKSISRRQMLRALRANGDFPDVGTMFLHSNSFGMQPALRLLDALVAKMVPPLSSHIFVYARKSKQGR